MKKMILLLLTVFLVQVVGAEDISVSSPNSLRTIGVNISEAGNVSLSIVSNGNCILSDSCIGLISDDIKFPIADGEIQVQENKVEQVITVPVPNNFSSILEAYNEKIITFSTGLSLALRAYNDGVAYRWQLVSEKATVKIDNEILKLKFCNNYYGYLPVPNGAGFFSHHENLFKYQKVSFAGKGVKACVPYLVELGNDEYALLSDVNVEHYPGLWLKGKFGLVEPELEAIFPAYPAKEILVGDRNLTVAKRKDYIAEVNGKSNLPWRAFVLGSANELLTTTMLYLLAEPSRISDTSWIKPGLVSWDWWNALNLTTVDFKTGVNQQTYKHYIDFASENGLPYVILDEGWCVGGPKNMLKVVDALDMPELSAYAESKNVGLILWMTSTALEENYDTAFQQFAAWNVKGLKIDFMQRDDQRMMEFCYKTAEIAANYKMLVDYHGGSKPAGITRTWPNVLTIESVQGLEQCKWGFNANPDMAVLLPFTRMVTGPMDYTPGAMKNKQKIKFSPNFNSPSSMGTRAHQLAMYVMYISPLQMLADIPCNYRANPESLEFIKNVPVTWDETVALKNKVGKYAAVARRNGDKWYIGALTGWKPVDLEVSLAFLGEGDWVLTQYKDGADASKDGNSLDVSEATVTGGSSLDITMVRGGGFAAVIEKK